RAVQEVYGATSDADLEALRERLTFMMTSAELRGAWLEHIMHLTRMIAESSARRMGQSPTSLEASTFGWVVHGVLVSAAKYWIDNPNESLPEHIERAFKIVEDQFSC